MILILILENIFSILYVINAYNVGNYKNVIVPTTKAYKIVGVPGSGTQLLPYTYVQNFVKWKQQQQQQTNIQPQQQQRIHTNVHNNNNNNNDETNNNIDDGDSSLYSFSSMSSSSISSSMILVPDDDLLSNNYVTKLKIMPSSQTTTIMNRRKQHHVINNITMEERIDPINTNTTTRSRKVQIRPTLHVLIKNGIPSYVMCGMQVRTLLHDDNNDKNDDIVDINNKDDAEEGMKKSKNVQNNNNNNITLLLLAQQWMTFAYIVEPNIRMIIYYGLGDDTDERIMIMNRTTILEHIEQLGIIISEQQSFSNGFHLITFQMNNEEWMTVSLDDQFDNDEDNSNNNDMNHNDDSCQSDDSHSKNNNVTQHYFTCILTGETIEGRELLTLSSELIEMTTTSVLKWNVSDIID